MNIGIFFESTEDHTQVIAERLRLRFERAGQQVMMKRCAKATPADVEAADLVVVGGSIHVGSHQKKLLSFAKSNVDCLSRKAVTGFFTVCLSARMLRPQDPEEVSKYEWAIREQTSWVPPVVRTFAGAVPYTRYGFFKRTLMKKIETACGGATDVSKDHVFTDWDAVDQFADELLVKALGAGS